MRIFSVFQSISSDLFFTFSSSKSFNICHLLAFSTLEISSARDLDALVQGRDEYLAIYAKSKTISFIALTVFWNCSSVSPGNQTIISVEIANNGSLERRYST
jgi:hypothetical protein